ncbi:1-phosphatidylinositol 3-phosphate 5-kinase [Drosophila montana]|uniref:1-phosphatidylinositol 3-phosphate 5-kinase n=1 Tax=Drosophila montana TaxID=40370 RepID=UPI00313F3BB2
MYTIDFDYEFNTDYKFVDFYAIERFIVPAIPQDFGYESYIQRINNVPRNFERDNNNNNQWRRSLSPYECYWLDISRPNMMTMDITKTEPGLVGLSSNQQQQQQQQQQSAQQQQQAANMNNNGQNNNGNNNGLSNGNSVNNNNNNSSNNNNNNNGNVQSIAAAANNNNNNNNGSQLCAGCGKHIQDRYLLRALDMLWHEDCLKCGCCDCRLGEVGSTLYTKGNLMLCKRDYLRLFGNTGYCAACSKVIPAFEMVMRARTNVYHLECFACQQCNHRFCVGDRFYLCENKILCEYDYEERLVFASMANHPMLKRHVSSLGQGSPTGAAGAAGAAGGLLGGGPGGVTGGANVNGGGGGGMVNGPRTPGDHNNNNGPQTPTGGGGGVGSPFAAAAAAAAAAHMKNQLGASS